MRACNNLLQPNPYILVFGGCGRLLHALTVPSCIYSFWHGVIPTSYFIFKDFYTCIYILCTNMHTLKTVLEHYACSYPRACTLYCNYHTLMLWRDLGMGDLYKNIGVISVIIMVFSCASFVVVSVSYMPIYFPIIMYGLRLFIVTQQRRQQ